MNTKLIAALALTPALAVATALPAQAATGSGTGTTVRAASAATMHKASPKGYACKGKLLTRKYAKSNGKVIGEVDIYWNRYHNVTVWACFRHAGSTWGKVYPTSVALVGARSATAKPSISVTSAKKASRMVGPVVLTGIRGNCVAAAGAIVVGKKRTVVTTDAWCYRG